MCVFYGNSFSSKQARGLGNPVYRLVKLAVHFPSLAVEFMLPGTCSCPVLRGLSFWSLEVLSFPFLVALFCSLFILFPAFPFSIVPLFFRSYFVFPPFFLPLYFCLPFFPQTPSSFSLPSLLSHLFHLLHSVFPFPTLTLR